MEECGCCGGARQLISDHDGLVEISPNPLLEGADAKVDPSEIEISETNNNPWCSVPAPPDRTSGYDPYLTFEFNSTYIMEKVKISGPDRGDRQYATALTFQNDTGQGFMFINDNSGNPKVSQF